jgi:hypothetical protein
MNLEDFGRFYVSLAAKFRGYALGTVLDKYGLPLGQSLKYVHAEY